MSRGLLGRRIPGLSRMAATLESHGDDMISSLEARAWWSRYGF
jgi:hypothetical protein